MAISGPHLPPQLLQTVPSHHLNVPCGVVILEGGRERGREGGREKEREGGREGGREKEREGGQDTYQSLLQASSHHGDTEAP